MGDLTDGLCGMTLGGVLRNQAMNYPKRVAVVDVDHEKRYTYEELNKRVNLLTNTLLKMGVKKGDIIGIFMRDLVEFIELMIALNKIGGIWAPCNYRFTPGEAQRQLLHSHPKMLFFEDAYVELVEEIKGSLPNIETYVAVGGEVPGYRSYEDLLKDSSEEEPQPEEEVTSEDIIGIIYTSGTTGVGKGSMHTHKSFLGWSFIAMYENSTGRHDRLLNPYPMFHMGGSIFCMTCVLAGATFYMFGKFDPLKFLKVVEEEKITVGRSHHCPCHKQPAPGSKRSIQVVFCKKSLHLQHPVFDGDPGCILPTVAPYKTPFNLFSHRGLFYQPASGGSGEEGTLCRSCRVRNRDQTPRP